jgi:hypothetical protein
MNSRGLQVHLAGSLNPVAISRSAPASSPSGERDRVEVRARTDSDIYYGALEKATW